MAELLSMSPNIATAGFFPRLAPAHASDASTGSPLRSAQRAAAFGQRGRKRRQTRPFRTDSGKQRVSVEVLESPATQIKWSSHPVIKVSVFYPNKPGARFDHAY